MTQRPLLVSLGSSFAAGPGLEPYDDAAALRSRRNYPHLLADRIGAELVDLTVSGATTATVLDTSQTTTTGTVFAPQLDGVPAGASLVTITTGGNDLGFIGAMLWAAWRRHAPGHPLTALLAQGVGGAIPEATAEAAERVTSGLVRIVEAVRGRAPRARVVLVDYLTVVDHASHGTAQVPLSPEELAGVLRLQATLAAGTARAADLCGAELFRASAISADHALGSPRPWVFPFQREVARSAQSFHPNALGVAAVAAGLADHLES